MEQEDNVFRNGGRSHDPESKNAVAPPHPIQDEIDEEQFIDNVTTCWEGAMAIRTVVDALEKYLSSESDTVRLAALTRAKGALCRVAIAPLERTAVRAPETVQAARAVAKKLQLWETSQLFLAMNLAEPDPTIVQRTAVAAYATQILNPERVFQFH
jgi:hypothetical protein